MEPENNFENFFINRIYSIPSDKLAEIFSTALSEYMYKNYPNDDKDYKCYIQKIEYSEFNEYVNTTSLNLKISENSKAF